VNIEEAEKINQFVHCKNMLFVGNFFLGYKIVEKKPELNIINIRGLFE